MFAEELAVFRLTTSFASTKVGNISRKSVDSDEGSSMKIALSNVGSEAWIGGVYYIANLIRALRSLPEDEQHEILLLVAGRKDAGHFADVDGGAETCFFPPFGHRLAAKLLRVIDETMPSMAGVRISLRLLDDRYKRGLARILESRNASILFPCGRSMGTDFPVPWLGWTADLQHKHFPHFFPEDALIDLDESISGCSRDARLMVASSQAVVTDFERFFPGYRDKLRVLRFRTVPIRSWFERDPAPICKRLGLPDRFVAIPNQLFIHKNHRTAFEAARIVANRGLDIHMACTGSTVDWRRPGLLRELSDYLEQSNLEGRVHILGFLPRHDQIQVQRRAMMIIQPSLFEGWSTVIEDARALGKRALVSDLPVHREQDLPDAVFFDPLDAEALAKKLQEAWDDLSPGPSFEDESEARERQESLVVQYGRDFLTVANELIGSAN